ncbi:MAG: indolepyruvate oxidoreductase subunit beta [Anaerolineae bacterium]|jgi:indolepyruvate ferredoxin oxidoreductase beta subunit
MDGIVNLLFVGVGGQGILTASDIAATVGLEAGFEAKKSEVHGFSQRGGVVESHVRWGDCVGSPTGERGSIDFLVAVELLESVRWIDWLRPGGVVVINRQRIAPMTVTVGGATYPTEAAILAQVRTRTQDVMLLDAFGIASGLGDARMTNTVLLGALSTRLEVAPEFWLSVIEQRMPPKVAKPNREAFLEGRRAVGRGQA